jgi:hypothetical protein
MIKLKTLLLEETPQQNTWKVPQGTPDDVINVLHAIIAEVIKNNKKFTDYVALQHIYKNKKIGRVWIVSNKSNLANGLVYHEWTSKWYSGQTGNIPLSPEELNVIIKKWVQ